jgi:hypothetical protein
MKSYQEKLSLALDKYPELGANLFISEATIDSILESDCPNGWSHGGNYCDCDNRKEEAHG